MRNDLSRLSLLFFSLIFSCVTSVSASSPRDRFILKGAMGERYNKCLNEWLLHAPYDNPGMLELYSLRNAEHETIVPWYGEFSGKYLTSAALAYAMMPDQRLKKVIEYVVDGLAKVQDSDGYLGVWPDAKKFVGIAPGHGKTWDVWAHYHNMLGLYYWYKISGSKKALKVLVRAADCIYNYYYVGHRLFDEQKDGTDAAVGHIFALLYDMTGDERYHDMINLTYDSFASPQGGNYFKEGLRTTPFYKMPRHRWECLHAIQTISEYCRITGDRQQLISIANIWRVMARDDRHNTGGFCSGEAAQGDPYDLRAIETCCTIAWMALGTDFLWLGKDSRVADELELSLWNGFLGAQLLNDKVFTYNTPMLGHKIPSTTDIAFQKISKSPDLNCCSVNAPRGFGMIGQWGARATDEAVTVNYYGESDITLHTPSGKSIGIVQTGAYPFDGDIQLKFSVKGAYNGKLRLRIPFWSRHTEVIHNGKPLGNVRYAEYLEIESLKNGDVVTIHFDMTPHYWHGGSDLAGKSSIYQGPILLTLDQHYDAQGYENMPMLNLSRLTLTPSEARSESSPKPYLLLTATDADGNCLTLCDFASAGQTGSAYTTWLPVAGNQTPAREIQPWGDRSVNN